MQVDAKRGDKKKTYHSRLVLVVVQIHVLGGIYGYVEKKIIKTPKKPKRTKEKLQHVLDSKRGASRGFPWTIEKRKNRSKTRERLK
jgi:hypothetical protein